MTGDGSTQPTRVELYARSTLPEAATRRRDKVAGRLKKLASEGHVSEVEIRNWDKKVPVDSARRERTRYDAFSAWADEVGVDLEPFFTSRQCYAMDSGEKGEWLVLPALCLAVYRGDELQTVYPHTTNDGSRSVMDCLHALESAHDHMTLAANSEPAEPEPEAIVETSD